MKCSGIKTAGQRSAAGGLGEVIRAGEPCNTVKKDHDIFLVFDKPLGPFNDHLGYSLVVFGKFIESRIDHFYVRSLNSLFDVRNFLRTLINEQDDQMDLGIVGLNGLSDLFHESRFSCLGGRYDHTSLSFAHRAKKVHNSHWDARSGFFEADPVIGKDRRHIFEIIALCSLLRL